VEWWRFFSLRAKRKRRRMVSRVRLTLERGFPENRDCVRDQRS